MHCWKSILYQSNHSLSTDISSTRDEWQDNNLMKMVGSNILTRKQLEKITRNKLIEFAMKLQNKTITKQIELQGLYQAVKTLNFKLSF